MRRAKATEAVQKNSYQPPASIMASAPAASKRARQPTVVDLFGRHQQQQQALQTAPEIIDLELDEEMDMS